MMTFNHKHPYEPFIPEGTEKLIVGTLPPPRFTTGELLPGDVDFCYGSRDGQLWQIISRIFDTPLEYETTTFAVEQRKDLLIRHKIGICDLVACAHRDKIDASDLGMKDAQLRPLLDYIRENKSIKQLLFMGGNSKNGPEYFFKKLIKIYGNIHLKPVNDDVPYVHQFLIDERIIETVSLTAPSGSANRAVGSMEVYKKLKAANPSFNTIDFRVMQYAPFFI
jgi:G:T/U-mismatch repair DNA glycosylase